jgi:hypothetical protein
MIAIPTDLLVDVSMAERCEIAVWWESLDEETKVAVNILFATRDTNLTTLRGSRTIQGTRRRLIVSSRLLERIDADNDAFDRMIESFEHLVDQANMYYIEPPLRCFYINGCSRPSCTEAISLLNGRVAPAIENRIGCVLLPLL